jgi:UDP-N-acetylglucosamine--N-acetylmuramyl-(pentapeptide) pyrophosphoryl-undecaprenol N-acetylglucosamine transferase
MNILIAAGGTGGHLFPGISIAEEFTAKDNSNVVLFIGTKRGMEQQVLSQAGFSFETIDVLGLKGKRFSALFKALLYLPRSIFQSIRIIKKFDPALVIGAGGYVSGPVVLAAFFMGIKTAIHEQNTFPGLANRILAKITDLILVSFESTMPYFPKEKTVMAGNPVRRQCVTKSPPSASGDPFTLCILGGSLGSHQINSAMTAALTHLLPIRDKIKIIHQTGKNDLPMAKEAYKKAGFSAEVVTFIDQIADVYQQTRLVISRAGASTLAELMVNHKASILVPYPLAADNHQHLNARVLVDQKAAQMIDPDQLTGTRLARLILHLYNHPEQLSEMETNAGKLGRPEAAREIVDHCYRLTA